jgi:hypothetical protein
MLQRPTVRQYGCDCLVTMLHDSGGATRIHTEPGAYHMLLASARLR